MELNLIELATGKVAGNVKVSSEIFEAPFNEPLVHQVVVSHLASARAGTKAQKTRAEVTGTGAKPWRQKGTGRARSGSVKSPVWVGGGAAFAAKNRDFTKKVNKKMYKGALLSIMAELNRLGRLVIVDDFKVEAPKTKEFKLHLNTLGLKEALVITEAFDEYLMLSARNLYQAGVTDVASIDPVSLIGYENVVITKGALKQFEESYS